MSTQTAPESTTLRTYTRLITSPWLLIFSLVASVSSLILRMQEDRHLSMYHADFQQLQELHVFRETAFRLLDGTPLYADRVPLENGFDLAYIYPPFAALFFQPLCILSEDATEFFFLIACTAALGWIIFLTLNRLGMPQPLYLTFALTPAFLWLDAVRMTLFYGQINLLLAALVLTDLWCTTPKWRKWAPVGTLIGIAVSIKLTAGIFLIYFVLRKNWLTLSNTVLAAIACNALGALLRPHETWEYYTDHMFHINDAVNLGESYNLSLRSVCERFLPTDSVAIIWGIAAIVTLVALTWVARQLLRAGEDTLALLTIAFLGLLISPISWDHHWVWMVPMIIALFEIGYRHHDEWLTLLVLLYLSLTVFFIPHSQFKHGSLIVDREPEFRDYVQSSVVWWAILAVAVLVWRTWVISQNTATSPAPLENEKPHAQ